MSEPAVNARILYWGIPGAGVTSNLHAVAAKLRPDHRGELREMPTRFDPTVSYEVLPISLGDIAGVRTEIQIVGAPGEPEQAPTRKQLLDRVDGVVFVVDSQRDRIDENTASFQELKQALAAYGRRLDAVPLVIQYNKRDLADPFALEELHRRLDASGAAVFEAVATERTGVLQTLSTISKKVIRTLRDQGGPAAEVGAAPAAPQPTAAPAPPQPMAAPELALESPPPPAPTSAETAPLSPADSDPALTDRMAAALEREEEKHPEAEAVAATASEAEALLETPSFSAADLPQPGGVRLGPDVSIVSVGEATRAGERAVRVPIVLGDSLGDTTTLVLTLSLDPLVDEGG